MSIGHRIDSPTSLKFVSDGVLEHYLNPQYQPGCGHHADPDCLCDVNLEGREPTPVVRVHPVFLNVETVEDLCSVAADIWASLDVLLDSDTEGETFLQDVPDEELQWICSQIAAGIGRNKLHQLCGRYVPDSVFATVRRALTLSHKSYSPMPVGRIVELGDAGMNIREIAAVLLQEMDLSCDLTSIHSVYKRATGRKLGRGKTPPCVLPRDRIMELHAFGLTAPEIRDRLAREGWIAYTASVARLLRRHKAKDVA